MKEDVMKELLETREWKDWNKKSLSKENSEKEWSALEKSETWKKFWKSTSK